MVFISSYSTIRSFFIPCLESFMVMIIFFSTCILVPFIGRALCKIKANTQIEKYEICEFKKNDKK